MRWGVGLAVVGLLAVAAWAVVDRLHPRPNVLLISIDSLRADHLHCYGYPRATSPAIDALARDGVRFATAVAPTSWTLPSHVTLLSGLPPVRHGVIDHDRQIAPETPLLAEVLRHTGYATAGFVAGAYLHSTFGFARGFEHYDDETVMEKPDHRVQKKNTSQESYAVTRAWLEQWQRERPDDPFFVFLHLWDVHYDFKPTPPYDRMFDPDYRGTVTGFHFMDSPLVHPGMSRRDLEHLIALYDGEIRLTDEYIGHLVTLLREMDVLDDTIIVITADHGEEFFEHGHKGHRNNLYDETLLVPLIVHYPRRVPAGVVVEGQVRLMDVAPTILALTGVEPPPALTHPPEGIAAARDLSPSWSRGGEAPELPAFAELHGRWVAVRTAAAKLIRYVGSEQLWHEEEAYRRATLAPPGRREHLYDLQADPGETRPLDHTHPARPTLDTALATWRERWAEHSVESPIELDEATEERLRRLGYME